MTCPRLRFLKLRRPHGSGKDLFENTYVWRLKSLCKKRAFETSLERGFGRRPFITVAWGDAPGRWVQPSCFWPQAILTSAVMPEIFGKYGLRPNNSNTHYVPGAIPQATVRIGLRPKRFTLATKTRNFKTRERGQSGLRPDRTNPETRNFKKCVPTDTPRRIS